MSKHLDERVFGGHVVPPSETTGTVARPSGLIDPVRLVKVMLIDMNIEAAERARNWIASGSSMSRSEGLFRRQGSRRRFCAESTGSFAGVEGAVLFGLFRLGWCWSRLLRFRFLSGFGWRGSRPGLWLGGDAG